MQDTYSRDGNGADPAYLAPDYLSTRIRAPRQPLIVIPQTLSEITGPVYGQSDVKPEEADLTTQHAGEPQGERIIVTGRVLDERGRPVPHTLVEIWQCNAAGRYIHVVDQHPAPLDPNFTGAGRTVTDETGTYRFTTVKPGAYPWRNHADAWRPAHIHFSLFGPSFLTRLVTQMYFPGDPLFSQDPIFNAVGDARARERMVCRFDLAATKPEWALGYVGTSSCAAATPRPGMSTMPERTPSQTIGPYLHIVLTPAEYKFREVFSASVADPGMPGARIRIEGASSTARAMSRPTRWWRMAGRPPGPLLPSRRPPAARLQLLPRLPPLRLRQEPGLRFRHRQARHRARPQRHDASAHSTSASSRRGS